LKKKKETVHAQGEKKESIFDSEADKNGVSFFASPEL
jgi:hypothetical protein